MPELVPVDTIARLVGSGIAPATLRKHFATELETGREGVTTRFAQNCTLTGLADGHCL